MSKKLEGNGLWESSRMMLPQHIEQTKALQNPIPPSKQPSPTGNEMSLMRDYVILPVALEIVEKNRIEIEMSKQTLKSLQSAAVRLLARAIREDMQKQTRMLLENHIHILPVSKEDGEYIYQYVCRGHSDQFTMTRDYMKSEISARIGRYTKNLITVFQEAAKNK